MSKWLFILLCTIHGYSICKGNILNADSSNYTSFLTGLQPGDTLMLAAGTYTGNLTLNGLNGTAQDPIVIMGSPSLYSTVFEAQACCNTVSITQCSYIVIKNLQLDGLNVAVDAVKAEGTTGNWAHHITLEYLNIIHYGNNQQIVGISTKCHAWNWVIRKNRIIGAGTGLYLGNSNGDKPFVNGIIEYNFVSNTLGYNMEIKHQLDTVRNAFPGTATDGKTIIRHNVFCKEQNGATGGNARPNLLVGGFPLSGWGMNDYYEIYGNFFYQNPDEALFQATGNVMLYQNIFVNHFDPAGYRAVYITPQNGVQPQNVRVFHNTIWTNNSSGGLRLYNPNTAYRQYCYGNAVFSPLPITNFTDSLDNVTDSYANAATYVLSANTNIASLDLYPASGQLTGTSTPDTPFVALSDYALDFNHDFYDWTYRGAYSGCCTNNGWQLQLDTMPQPGQDTIVSRAISHDLRLNIFPNPGSDEVQIDGVDQNVLPCSLRLYDLKGVLKAELTVRESSTRLSLLELPPGLFIVKLEDASGNTLQSARLVHLQE